MIYLATSKATAAVTNTHKIHIVKIQNPKNSSLIPACKYTKSSPVVKVMYHFKSFQIKHGLNAENLLTGAQSFPPFGEIVFLLFKSTL